jgi:hypothetical protein
VSDYDLRAAVCEALDDGGCDSYREYAERVIARMPRSEAVLRAALLETLPRYIRNVNRMAAGPMPVIVPDRRPVTDGSVNGWANGSAVQHVSRRVLGHANEWDRILCRQIPTPTGQIKPLGDATHDEVAHYAGTLRRKGMETLAVADRFDQLVQLMDELRVDRVRDIPPHLGSAVIAVVA